jgi:hypothetical protein
LKRKWKRNPEIIDLTAEDDVVNILNKLLISKDLTLAKLKPLITFVFSLEDNHRSNIRGASPIFYDHSATTSVVYATIKLFYNAHSRYDFFGGLNTEEDAVQKYTIIVSVSR